MNKKLSAILILLLISAFVLSGCNLSTLGGKKEQDYDLSNYFASDGLDTDGFFNGLTASDYVELPEYKGVKISASVFEASEDDLNSQIESILAEYTTYEEITDRAVEDGDSVNIDYVGRVDGVEFEGGSTGGMGTDVTIGVTNYIDDFLEQLIGHFPGDRFDVEVTFPATYGVDSLNGKDAVFDVTINHINGEELDIELNDDIAKDYGFDSVDALKEDIRTWLINQQKSDFFTELITQSEIKGEIPKQVMDFVIRSDLSDYQYYADMYGVSLDEFMYNYAGYENVDVYIENNKQAYETTAKAFLAVQAIAEKENIKVTDMNVSDAGLSDYVETYGMPYLKQYVMQTITIPAFVTDNAVIE